MYKPKRYIPFNKPRPPLYEDQFIDESEPIVKSVVKLEPPMTSEEMIAENEIEVIPRKKKKDYPGMDLLRKKKKSLTHKTKKNKTKKNNTEKNNTEKK